MYDVEQAFEICTSCKLRMTTAVHLGYVCTGLRLHIERALGHEGICDQVLETG
jgi:hypothetical protein